MADLDNPAGGRRPTLRERTPLRTQLVVSVLALAALAVLVVAAAGAFVLRDYLYSRVDTQLRESLRPLAEAGAVNPGDTDGHDADDFRPPTVYFGQVYAADGSVLGTLGSPLPSDVAPPELPTLDATTVADLAGDPFTAGAADGGDWRVLVLAVDAPTQPQIASVAVGLPLDDVQATVARLVGIDLVVALVALLLLAVVAHYVVKANLRPLVEVEETAEAIAGGDLTRRVPVRDVRTEVGRLGTALNVMLGRIEAAFTAQQASEAQARASEERMRRFVADASHELRTPLTTIRGFAELHRHGAVADGEPTQQAMQRIEDAAARMGLLVDDLLLLARLDQQRPLDREPVDLVALATDAVHDARVLSTEHPVTLSVLPGPAPVVDGDPQRLRQVVTNLLANAVTHTPPGTPVTVTVGVPEPDAGSPAAPAWALVEVRDAGPGLSPGDAERVFERFYRADESRSSTGRADDAAGGTGLGLAIVAALVAAHGGSVDVESQPGQGAAFRVHLPLLPA